MSPGNSYFKDEEVLYLLKTVVEKFGRVGIFIADIPAISTYIAFGYPENRARRDKAIPQGNSLKNRVVKVMGQLGYTDEIVRIFDWEKEIENNPEYKSKYEEITLFYKNNDAFGKIANSTTRVVLEGSNKNIVDIEKATTIAVHYLLSEFAFLEFAPQYLGVEKVVYIYHKNWLVYEDYISGKFDDLPRPYLDFLLLENPYETYNPMWSLEDEGVNEDYKDNLDRIEKTKVLRVGFTNYTPALMYDKEIKVFSGIFYEILMKISQKYGWEVRWTEEVGYGVIIEGLNNKRFDIFGSTVWPTPERLSKANFSTSLYKSPTFAWIRPDYIKSLKESKEDKNIRIAVKENDITDSIANADFPDNRIVRVPQLSDTTEVLKFVAEDRADITFAEVYLVEHFNKTSMVKLVPISKIPIRIYDNALIFRQGEVRLGELINKELDILRKSGVIKDLIIKYTGKEDTFI